MEVISAIEDWIVQCYPVRRQSIILELGVSLWSELMVFMADVTSTPTPYPAPLEGEIRGLEACVNPYIQNRQVRFTMLDYEPVEVTIPREPREPRERSALDSLPMPYDETDEDYDA